MISNKSNSYGFYESTIQGNASFDVVGNWALGSNSKSWFLMIRPLMGMWI